MSAPDHLKKTVIKKSQQFNLLGIITTVFLMLSLFVLYLHYFSNQKSENNTNEKEPTHFTSSLDHVDGGSVWQEKFQGHLRQLEEKQASETKQLNTLVAQNKALEDSLKSTENKLLNQFKTINRKHLPPQSAGNKLHDNKTDNKAFWTSASHSSHQARSISTASDRIVSGKVDLTSHELKQTQPEMNPHNYVPAGTYAVAIMLGGADAAAGALNQSDPKPMLFRIITQGKLPNGRRSHLKGCVATAAVIGDISAERGAIRLERLSCTQSNDRIIDVAVEGTIFGFDGKNGVRGKALWREGTLVKRAGIAGFLSGVGQGIQGRFTPQLALTTNGNNLPSATQIIGQGVGGGMKTAFDKLADYNIKRAEQYHPVIQISAGQKVDVVFLKGFFIDGMPHGNS